MKIKLQGCIIMFREVLEEMLTKEYAQAAADLSKSIEFAHTPDDPDATIEPFALYK